MVDMDTLHVAIDLDDVILDFCGGLWAAIEHEHDITLPPVTKWEIHDILDPIVGKDWFEWLKDRQLWNTFPPMVGAMGGLNQLRKDGHYLEIVTSKPQWAERSTWKWIGDHAPPVHRVTIADMKTLKVNITNADILIDDRPENVEAFADDGRVGILFTRPHNIDHWVDIRSGVARANDWHEVVELVRREAGGRL
jgi:5'(3')-deoxyribonucleotidase